MKNVIRGCAVCFILFAFVFFNCQPDTISLWNGQDFSGWELFVPDEEVDVNTVWSVKDGVIHCTGVPNGYMRTVSEYSDYTLTLEWRWVENGGNSGVLLHSQPPDKVWPKCIECQLQSGNAGDFVVMGGGTITVNGEEHKRDSGFIMIPKMEESSEKPLGEWNTYRIICSENEITCYVNDVLQNKGTNASLSKGKICFQSEGAPIEFRNIQIESMNK
ncbi:DUF1080 domain-containing protein [candidate division KSB1 bacterium]